MPAKAYQPRTEAPVSEDNFSCEAESCVIWVCGLLCYIWYVVYGTCFAGGMDFWVGIVGYQKFVCLGEVLCQPWAHSAPSIL